MKNTVCFSNNQTTSRILSSQNFCQEGGLRLKTIQIYNEPLIFRCRLKNFIKF